MKLIRELPLTPIFQTPSVITIGNFDGMHLGHQAVIKKLVETAHSKNLPSVVLSFENHPLEVLRPDIPICKICTPEHKIHLLEKMGVDVLILMTFTQEFSEQTAEEFLFNVQKKIPFSEMILGWDATLGKNKHGNKAVVQALAKKNHFHVHYLEQQNVDGLPVSSSQIRQMIQEGRLDQAQKLLGRTYSIYSTVYQGKGNGKKLGFPTANLNVQGLCLPPLGVYAVTSIIDNVPFKGVANLGIAPTMRKDHIPVLEVHIFDCQENLYEKSIEVKFSSFLRPEMTFSSVEDLKIQIQNDIFKAKQLS
jgi:riboflavin kinase / FMN adenylyltransferase